MSPDRQTWWSRLLRRREAPQELDPARADLVVVASSFDDAEAGSTALERAATSEPRWDPGAPAVLRHHLVLPAAQVADAVAVAAQDGYTVPAPSPGPSPGPPTEPATDPAVAAALTLAREEVEDAQGVVLQRVQVLDALHCSQERSRMAGLAQRRAGLALGWDALQPRR